MQRRPVQPADRRQRLHAGRYLGGAVRMHRPGTALVPPISCQKFSSTIIWPLDNVEDAFATVRRVRGIRDGAMPRLEFSEWLGWALWPM